MGDVDIVARNQIIDLTKLGGGIVADGITDNASALQYALDSAKDNTTIYISLPGVIAIGPAGLNLTNRKGLALVGQGIIKFLAPTTQGYGASYYGLWLSNCSYIRILGLTFIGFNNTANNNAGGIVGFISCDHCEFSNNDVSGSGNALAQVLSVGGGTHNKFNFNNIHDPGGTNAVGLWTGNNFLADIETNCQIIGNYIHDHPYTGIGPSGANYIIANNFLYNNGHAGVAIGGNDTVTSTNFTISGNVCWNNEIGIQADSEYHGATATSLLQNFTITGNVCHDNSQVGIFTNWGTGWTVTGNTCFNNGNAITGGIGIEVGDWAIDYTVLGNSCYDTRTPAYQNSGINIVSTVGVGKVYNITCVGNTCSGNLYDGITFDVLTASDIKQCLIVGNTCNNNGRAGIFSDEVDIGSLQAIIDGNVCHGNTSYDIRATNVDCNVGDNNYETQLGLEYATLTALSATPNVYHRQTWLANNVSATSITSLLGLADGRGVAIIGGNSNTTFINSAGLVLKGAANVNLPTNGIINFRQLNGIIYEETRSF